MRRWFRLPTDARLPLATVAAAAFLAVGGIAVNERVADWLLRADAEATARAWTEGLDRALGDELIPLLNRQLPSAAALTALEHARVAGGAFRFKLFDAAGNLVFVSDDLSAPEQLETTLAAHRGNSAIAAGILGGGVHLESQQGTPPHRPAFYAEAYLPVWRNDAIVGVAEVYIDQTAKRSLFRRAFLLAELVIAGLVVLAGLLPAGLAWLRSRQRRTAEAHVQFLAHHDALTGLPNRETFGICLRNALECAREDGSQVGVIALDLDRFKEVNDLLGHAAGDALLRAVALRMRAAVREADTVARLGGDEFAVVQVGLQQPDGAGRLAERLVAIMAEPYDLPGGERCVTGVSAGIVISAPDCNDADTLLRAADAALYRAKAEGRGTSRFHHAGMDEALRERRQLTADLREAVACYGLDLHFQPLFNLTDGSLAGFEALLRWTHPTRGPISPAEFVPLAEETGLIVPIGSMVLRKACRAAAGWPGDLKVAVNLSPAQFRKPGDLLAAVRDALAHSGLPAQRLELEVTEGLLLRDTEPVLQALAELRDLGCSIAMDDFGTGYSSLAYLWRFPFDKLKIDRAFVAGMKTEPKAQAIVSTIVALGQTLGLRITAEGVETAEQAEDLRRAGCDQGQGFLLGRPAPLAETARLAASHRPVQSALAIG